MRTWINGRLVDGPHAVVPVADHGFTVGDGVFETMRVERLVPFAYTRHVDRLARSAAALGLPPVDRDAVRQGCDAVLGAWDAARAGRLRVTYTAGVAALGSARAQSEPTLVVSLADAGEPAAPVATVATAPWPRNERGPLAGVKSTSYAENVVALAWARARGADEALFADTTGRLCEGTASNVFVVLGGRLVTPTTATGCLAGVTRGLVLEWCGAVEEDLPVEALGEAEEVFLTSSLRDVQPVGRADGRDLAAPGPVTRAAAESFAEHSARNPDP